MIGVDHRAAVVFEGRKQLGLVHIRQTGQADGRRPVNAVQGHAYDSPAVQRSVRAGQGVGQAVALFVGDHGAHHLQAGGTVQNPGLDPRGLEQREEIVRADRQIEEKEILVFEVFQRQGRSLRQGVVLAQQDIGRQADQGPEAHLGLQLKIIGDQQVQLRAAQGLKQLFLVALVRLDLDHRMIAHERMDQLRQDHGRQGDEAAHRQPTPHLVAEVERRGGQLFRLGQELFRLLQKDLAGERQRQPLGMVTHEQLHAELSFQ